MNFGICKNGWSGPEYNHLDREQHGKLQDSVDIKPGGIWDSERRGLVSLEDCITTERRGLYDYLKESKEDMLSGALKENVIEEGETKEEFTKRKRDEIKKTFFA